MLTFGLLLSAMGYAIYFATGRTTFSAMTPTFLGIPIVLCAVVANTVALRKAAWGGAVACAVVGIGLSLVELHAVGAFDASRRPAAIGLTADAPSLPPDIARLEPEDRGLAIHRAQRHWRAALLSWPVFALFCAGFIGLSWSEIRGSRKVPTPTAT